MAEIFQGKSYQKVIVPTNLHMPRKGAKINLQKFGEIVERLYNFKNISEMFNKFQKV